MIICCHKVDTKLFEIGFKLLLFVIQKEMKRGFSGMTKLYRQFEYTSRNI